MSKTARYIIAFVLLVFLVLVRAYEDVLFYDPYLIFFENDYFFIDSPRREVAKLLFFTFLRYLVNSLLSLGIIYCAFKDKQMIKFSAIVFLVGYMFFMIPFLYFVINPRQEDYYLFFNVRRFLIQPIIFLLLLPALYYFKLKR